MNHLFKKLSVAVMIFTFVFLYAFSANQASAAVGSRSVEKSFVMDYTINFPGAERETDVGTLTFKTTLPERVKPGEEFYLTNTSYTMTPKEADGLPYESIVYFKDLSFTVSSENETNSFKKMFLDDVKKIIVPAYATTYDLVIGGEGIEVGPFIAGQEGEVIIKADSITFTMGWDNNGEPVFPPLTFVGLPSIDSDLVVATIPIDQPPVLKLNGKNEIIVEQGDPYEEPGATAEDDFDGDLTDKIEISGNVDTNTIGTYTVTYTVTDSVGNVVTAERTVKVVEPFGDFYSGEGPPSDSLGSNGDTYLDVTTGDVYKRNPNTWTKVGNIKGDDGKQGSKILTGEGAPKADLGNVGDLYFDTKTGDVYEKTADGWVKIANLQGPAGPQGPKGADGTGGTSGDSDSSGKDKQSKTGSSKVASKDASDKKGSSAKGGKLPKTATSLPTLILVGAMLVVAGTILFIRHRKVME